MNETTKHHWNERFGNTEPEALTWYQADNDTSLDLIRTHSGAPGDSVIDIGAGAAGLAGDLIAAGFGDITLLDISERALRESRCRLGDAAAPLSFCEADVTRWTPPRRWDIWHDRAVFHFLTDAAAQDAYLVALRAATAPGALVLIATFSPEGPEKCSGLPVQRYGVADLARRLGDGFRLLEGLQRDHVTPKGGRQNFTHAVLRRL